MALVESRTITRSNFEFQVSVYAADDATYTICIEVADYSRGAISFNMTTALDRIARIAGLSEAKKRAVLAGLDRIIDDYLRNKCVCSEIDESQAMYDGMNQRSSCDCCGRGVIGFYRSDREIR